MKEEVNESKIKELKSRKRNSETEISLENGLINIKIDGEEHIGLTPQEVAQRYGTNYYIMNGLRYLFDNEEIEETIKEEQSLKKEVIDIFIKTLEQNNIFEGKISIEEIRERLEENIDAVYIVNEGYREGIGGCWNTESRNLYILSRDEVSPEELKKLILSQDIEKLIDINSLGLICHEVLHALSQGKGKNDGFYKVKEDGTTIGYSINEGMTEILTEQMVPSTYKTYENEVDITKFLLTIFGDDIDMIDAYLNSDFDAMVDMATERRVPSEFMKLVKLSDCLVSQHLPTFMKEQDPRINAAKAALINRIGEIDIYKFIEQDIPIPEGINSDIIIKAFENLSLENEEFINTEKFNKAIENNYMLRMCFIDFKNGGEINFEEYIKSHIIAYPEQIAKNFFSKGKGHDLETYLKMVINSIDLLEKDYSGDIQGELGALLIMGIENHSEYCLRGKELNDFKRDVIEEIVYNEMGQLGYSGRYITAENQEGCSWKEMISQIEKFEYYYIDKDTGMFLVNTETGTILGVQENSEVVNIEDVKLQEENLEERNPNAIKYTFEDKPSKIFLSEKDKEGKYVLKGFIQDEDGKNIEIDVGFARNFLDDTTEIDRQIISQTSEVRSGSIREVAETIKSAIIREDAEKETIHKEGEEHE